FGVATRHEDAVAMAHDIAGAIMADRPDRRRQERRHWLGRDPLIDALLEFLTHQLELVGYNLAHHLHNLVIRHAASLLCWRTLARSAAGLKDWSAGGRSGVGAGTGAGSDGEGGAGDGAGLLEPFACESGTYCICTRGSSPPSTGSSPSCDRTSLTD